MRQFRHKTFFNYFFVNIQDDILDDNCLDFKRNLKIIKKIILNNILTAFLS